MDIRPGPNPKAAAERLAELIINRWMPHNAGGAIFLLVPKLAAALCPLFERTQLLTIQVDTFGTIPVIKEVVCANKLPVSATPATRS